MTRPLFNCSTSLHEQSGRTASLSVIETSHSPNVLTVKASKRRAIMPMSFSRSISNAFNPLASNVFDMTASFDGMLVRMYRATSSCPFSHAMCKAFLVLSGPTSSGDVAACMNNSTIDKKPDALASCKAGSAISFVT